MAEELVGKRDREVDEDDDAPFVAKLKTNSGAGAPRKVPVVESGAAAAGGEDAAADAGAAGAGAGASKPAKSQMTRNEQGELTLELNATKRLSVHQYKGQTLVDFRAYYMDQKTGTMKPTKTGMSLTVDAWHKVLENIDEINAAVAELEKK